MRENKANIIKREDILRMRHSERYRLIDKIVRGDQSIAVSDVGWFLSHVEKDIYLKHHPSQKHLSDVFEIQRVAQEQREAPAIINVHDVRLSDSRNIGSTHLADNFNYITNSTNYESSQLLEKIDELKRDCLSKYLCPAYLSPYRDKGREFLKKGASEYEGIESAVEKILKAFEGKRDIGQIEAYFSTLLEALKSSREVGAFRTLPLLVRHLENNKTPLDSLYDELLIEQKEIQFILSRLKSERVEDNKRSLLKEVDASLENRLLDYLFISQYDQYREDENEAVLSAKACTNTTSLRANLAQRIEGQDEEYKHVCKYLDFIRFNVSRNEPLTVPHVLDKVTDAFKDSPSHFNLLYLKLEEAATAYSDRPRDDWFMQNKETSSGIFETVPYSCWPGVSDRLLDATYNLLEARKSGLSFWVKEYNEELQNLVLDVRYPGGIELNRLVYSIAAETAIEHMGWAGSSNEDELIIDPTKVKTQEVRYPSQVSHSDFQQFYRSLDINDSRYWVRVEHLDSIKALTTDAEKLESINKTNDFYKETKNDDDIWLTDKGSSARNQWYIEVRIGEKQNPKPDQVIQEFVWNDEDLSNIITKTRERLRAEIKEHSLGWLPCGLQLNWEQIKDLIKSDFPNDTDINDEVRYYSMRGKERNTHLRNRKERLSTCYDQIIKSFKSELEQDGKLALQLSLPQGEALSADHQKTIIELLRKPDRECYQYFDEELLMLVLQSISQDPQKTDMIHNVLFYGIEQGYLKLCGQLINDSDIDVNRIKLVSGTKKTALRLAAIYGRKDIVELLLKAPGIDVNFKDNYGETALLAAAKMGRKDMVALLLKDERVNVNGEGPDKSALLEAAIHGYKDVAEVLLKDERFNVNIKAYGKKALLYAAEHGRKDVVALLLEDERFDVNGEPLVKAAERGHKDVVALLLKSERVKVNARNVFSRDRKSYGDRAFLCAAQGGCKGVVEELLKDKRVDVNTQCSDGETALFLAVEMRYNNVVDLLLQDKRVDVNIQCTNDETALIAAAKSGNTDVVELLLQDEKVEVNRQNDKGYTALIKAAESGFTDAVNLLLRDKRVDVNIQNDAGWTALMRAVQTGRTNTVKILLEDKRVDVNIQNTYGETALIKAAQKRNTEVVKLLLDSPRIDVNAKDFNDDTALFLAVEMCYNNVVDLLLKDKRVDVNIQCTNDETALIAAAKSGNTDVVELLLKSPGIDVDAKDKDDMTALMIAKREGHQEVVSLLERYNQALDKGVALAEEGSRDGIKSFIAEDPFEMSYGVKLLEKAASKKNNEGVEEILSHLKERFSLEDKSEQLSRLIKEYNEHTTREIEPISSDDKEVDENVVRDIERQIDRLLSPEVLGYIVYSGQGNWGEDSKVDVMSIDAYMASKESQSMMAGIGMFPDRASTNPAKSKYFKDHYKEWDLYHKKGEGKNSTSPAL